MIRELSIDFVRKIFAEGVTDITLGGLVLGDRHSEGGIQVMQFQRDRIFHICEIEGGEFIINHFATKANLARLKEINSYTGGDDKDLAAHELANTPVFEVPSGHWVLLRAPSMSIIRRSATKRYLRELTEINESAIRMFPHEGQK